MTDIMKRAAGAVAICGLMAASGPAMAQRATEAWLLQVEGTVLVDQGAGFVPVTGNMELSLGDRVLVSDGGKAVLSYRDDCSAPLEAPSMTTVTEMVCTTSAQGSHGDGAAVVLLSATAVTGLLNWCLVAWCKERSASP